MRGGTLFLGSLVVLMCVERVMGQGAVGPNQRGGQNRSDDPMGPYDYRGTPYDIRGTPYDPRGTPYEFSGPPYLYPHEYQGRRYGSPWQGGPNYDPFQFNPYTGRWDYVPVPREPQRYGPNYDPFRFNWSSGRWDYVPYPPPPTSGSPYRRE